MDVNALIMNRSDENPSGENLEYDSEFVELELAASPKEEQQIGDEVIAAVEPDYSDVKSKALALLERTHDLRIAMRLASAELATSGFSGFADAITYARRCLDEHWDSCHPQLDEDDGDPTMRVNAVLTMADDTGLLRVLRRAPLTDSRGFGRFSYRDIEVAEGLRAAPADMESVPDTSAISAAFQDTDPELLKLRLEDINRAHEEVAAIDKIFDEKIPGQGPELGPVKAVLAAQVAKLNEMTGGSAAPADSAGDGDEVGDAGGAPSGGAVGGIANTNDVTNALDRIIEYYRRNEPSSPVPILLERAKRLVNADFMTIVKDMAPSGVDNVNLVGGINPEDGY